MVTCYAILLPGKWDLTSLLPLHIRLEHLGNNFSYYMFPYVGAPMELADGVVHNALAKVAARLEGISALCTRGVDASAGTLWDRIGVVVNMGDGKVGGEAAR
jgi:hypothetical protein